MFNLYKCALLDAYPTVCVESEAEGVLQDTEAPAGHLNFFLKNNLKYAVWFLLIKVRVIYHLEL